MALVIVLVLLLVMTVMGISSMRGALLEERMSGNLYDRAIMFQAAEAALREGEAAAAASRKHEYTTSCTSGLCSAPEPTCTGTGNNPTCFVLDRWTDPNQAFQSASAVGTGTLAVTPEYIVEYLGDFPNWVGCDRAEPMPVGCLGPRYRVTARATAAGRSAVLLQSVFTSPD